MKRLVSVVLTGMLILGTASIAYADTSNVETAGNAKYKDLKNTNWAYEAVNTMSQKGIVKGYTDGKFRPSNVVTYGEFIKMALVSATKVDVGNAPYVNPITGAKQNWAKSYYDKALGLNYFGNTDIEGNQLSYPISRSDMALIISNILGEIKIDNYDELERDLKDVNSETKNDYDIIKVYATGIITGYQDSTFRSEKTLTRAESATVIYRFVDESKRVLLEEKEKEEIIVNDTNKLYKTVNTKDYLDPATVYYTEVPPNNTGEFEDTAEFYSDASIFDMKMHTEYQEKNGRWGCSFTHELCGYVYLVKDGVITTWCQTSPMYDEDANFLDYFGSMSSTDVKDADYIVVASSASQEKKTWVTRIIVNPFKK